MDKENLQLLILTLFAMSGILLFLILLLFFEPEHEHGSGSSPQDGNIKDGSKSPMISKKAFATEEELSAVLRGIPVAKLKAATGNFCDLNLLRAGYGGDTYAGVLDGNELVLVKRFETYKTDIDHYGVEMEFYTSVPDNHFLVPLLGFCDEGDEKLLVYKYVANGDLATVLAASRTSIGFDQENDEADSAAALPWITRLKIAIGVAEALVFLHHECCPGIAHRNIQASNIFLTRNFDIKLASLSEAQTLEKGAMPVYDVYCFGKVLLDLISGLNISGSSGDPFAESWMLKALPLIGLQTKDSFLELTDASMILEEDLANEVLAVAILAKACLDPRCLQSLSMITVLNFLRNPKLPS